MKFETALHHRKLEKNWLPGELSSCKLEDPYSLSCSKKDIPVTNYRMHTLHCARNMVKCGECDLMVGKENLELHNMEFHSLVVCDQCGVSIEAYKLPEHKVWFLSFCEKVFRNPFFSKTHLILQVSMKKIYYLLGNSN